MPAFATLLTGPEIRAMVYYLRETRATLRAGKSPGTSTPDRSVRRSERHAYRLEIVADGLMTPWGMTFLPTVRLLVSERPGTIRVLDLGQPITPDCGYSGRVGPAGRRPARHRDPSRLRRQWVGLPGVLRARPAPTSTTKIVRGRNP
jgi:glucose/arabinose dehydrogenase